MNFYISYIRLSLLVCAVLLISRAVSSDPSKTPARRLSTVSNAPIKALVVTGGLWHKYDRLVPYLEKNLTRKDNIQFQTVSGLEVWSKQNFAEGYDLIIYDMCFDDVEDALLANALEAGKQKPTIFIHCAVHSFRDSKKVHEWEEYVGLRSKFHDKFGPFETERGDPASPILNAFPDHWKTKGDELYQTIELLPGSHPLLSATSPRDGRTHVVAWTHTYGSARVFATTLGHDKKSAETSEYQQLLANAVLWACGRLQSS